MRAEGNRDIRFQGTRKPAASSSAMVVVVDAASGDVLGLLEHRVRYSPTGFNWGYDGAGPRDLARSLLAAALPDEALCAACRGATSGCSWCHEGLRPELPSAAFTSEVIARLTPNWSLHAEKVRGWWNQHRDDNGIKDPSTTP